jgi:hypothetical protein
VLEPRNHLLKLPGEDSSVIEGQADALLIARGPALAPAHLLPHEPKRDADRRGSKAGAKSAPNFIADLYPRHPVARGCSLSRGPFSTQPRSLAHVYTYTMSPWVELCAAKRSTATLSGGDAFVEWPRRVAIAGMHGAPVVAWRTCGESVRLLG